MNIDSQKDEISILLKDIIKREAKLSEWESNFINSILASNALSLTKRQIDTINKIWERVT